MQLIQRVLFFRKTYLSAVTLRLLAKEMLLSSHHRKLGCCCTKMKAYHYIMNPVTTKTYDPDVIIYTYRIILPFYIIIEYTYNLIIHTCNAIITYYEAIMSLCYIILFEYCSIMGGRSEILSTNIPFILKLKKLNRFIIF